MVPTLKNGHISYGHNAEIGVLTLLWNKWGAKKLVK